MVRASRAFSCRTEEIKIQLRLPRMPRLGACALFSHSSATFSTAQETDLARASASLRSPG
jgi:hypothetical protein